MKRGLIRLAVVAGVVVLIVAAVLRARLPDDSSSAAKATSSAPAALELAATDLASATTRTLVRTLPVSGSVEAVSTAVVKARIAAVVQTLSVREGDPVRAGQRIGQLDDSDARWRLRQAEDQVAAAQAQLDIAERTLANNRALVAQGFISQNALETAASNAAAARASRAAAQAAAELARRAVQDALVTAPITGQVAQRFVQPGERVNVDARLVEIVDLSRLELAAAMTPADAALVRVGQTASLSVEGQTAPLSARVARINPSAQAGTRAVMVYLALDAAPGLRSGLFANGQVQVDQRPAQVVPVSALRIDGARPYVLTVTDGRVQRLDVTPGQRGEAAFDGAPEAAVEVTAGLEDGSLVLRGSVGALRAGTPVALP
jgi:RND family efflux transporter MFP subunit